MQSHLPRTHEFFTLDIQCQFVIVLLKCLKRLSQFIIRLFNFHLGVLASLIISAIRCNVFSRLSQTFRGVPSLTLYSCPSARLLNMFGLLKFAIISRCWALVKRIASSFIHFPLRFPLWFIESQGLESDMSKVRTYQLSAPTAPIQRAYLSRRLLYMAVIRLQLLGIAQYSFLVWCWSACFARFFLNHGSHLNMMITTGECGQQVTFDLERELA